MFMLDVCLAPASVSTTPDHNFVSQAASQGSQPRGRSRCQCGAKTRTSRHVSSYVALVTSLLAMGEKTITGCKTSRCASAPSSCNRHQSWKRLLGFWKESTRGRITRSNKTTRTQKKPKTCEFPKKATTGPDRP